MPPLPSGLAVAGINGQAHFHELSRLRTAALRARRVYPGELGELVSRELSAFAEFGVRFAADAMMSRVADLVLAAPLPAQEPAGAPLR
jgi:hypothetical protein